VIATIKPIPVPRPRFSAAAEGASPVTAAAEPLPIAQNLLDGGELVLLAIKPSLWFVLFDAARWVAVGALLVLMSLSPSLEVAGMPRMAVAQIGLVLIAARLGVASLRWVSRFYILTNRRIMRLRGVFRPDILSCPLLAIQSTSVSVGPHEKVTKLGTLRFEARDFSGADLDWYNIPKHDEVHSRVRRAIERAHENRPRSS
jgi:hypothetical protein